MNTHATPFSPFSPPAPISAAFPLLESAMLDPKRAKMLFSLPVNKGPCWCQLESERVKAETAPPRWISEPPIRTVASFEDSAMLSPKWLLRPASLERSVQLEPVRVKTQTAPWSPISASFPVGDRASARPNSPLPLAAGDASFGPASHAAPDTRERPHRAASLVVFRRGDHHGAAVTGYGHAVAKGPFAELLTACQLCAVLRPACAATCEDPGGSGIFTVVRRSDDSGVSARGQGDAIAELVFAARPGTEQPRPLLEERVRPHRGPNGCPVQGALPAQRPRNRREQQRDRSKHQDSPDTPCPHT